MNKFSHCIFIIFYFFSYSANAVDQWQPQQQEQKNQLSVLQQKIDKLKNVLTSKKQQQQQFLNELKKTELAISQQLLQQHETKQVFQQQKKLQQKLEHQQQQLQQNYENERQQLFLQLHLAYLIDDPSFIRLLLSQQQTLPNNHRMMTYLRYVYNDQQQRLQQLTKIIEQLKFNRQKLQEVIKSIEVTQNEQKQQYQILQQEQYKREILLTQINRDIGQKTSKLISLEIDRKNLEEVLEQLQTQKPVFSNHAFGSLKGKLPLPTQGTIIKHFGSHSASDQYNLKGILIAAPSGQEVRAIHPGKVIFADQLKSFGLLMIIEHGDGFMTLYARNQSIFKKLGDNVALNEVIARVGQSGGHEKSGLYFEIRHNGHPKNPETWCKVYQNRRV